MAETTETYKNGRPFKFTDPAELRLKIQTYFDLCDPHIKMQKEIIGHKDDGRAILADREVMTKQKPYLITGLARHLGVHKDTLKNYTRREHYDETISDEVREEIISSIEEAYDRVHEFNEDCLYSSTTFNGAKFNLTNNYGWVDRKEVDQKNTNVDAEIEAMDQDDIADNAKDKLGEPEADAEPETPQ